MAVKVLWFSRHEMSTEQKNDLFRIYGPNLSIDQVNKTIISAYELQAEISSCDILAIVAPINIQSQFMKLAGEKPVIMAVSKRVLLKNPEGGEDKVSFVFDYWQQLKKIEVITERL